MTMSTPKGISIHELHQAILMKFQHVNVRVPFRQRRSIRRSVRGISKLYVLEIRYIKNKYKHRQFPSRFEYRMGRHLNSTNLGPLEE